MWMNFFYIYWEFVWKPANVSNNHNCLQFQLLSDNYCTVLYLLSAESSLVFLPSREARCCSRASRRLLGACGRQRRVSHSLVKESTLIHTHKHVSNAHEVSANRNMLQAYSGKRCTGERRTSTETEERERKKRNLFLRKGLTCNKTLNSWQQTQTCEVIIYSPQKQNIT